MRPAEALHTRVTTDVTILAGLLARLEAEIPQKRRSPHGGFGSGKGGHGPLAAWNSAAAMLILDVHAGARELETDLRYQITGAFRVRGASARNTGRCLEALPGLCAAADYALVTAVCRRLEAWIWRGQLILGDAEPLARLPRPPGQGDPACPYCGTRGSLRVRHSTGVVTCLRPGCRDTAGDRPAGRIEVGGYSGEAMLAWRDGMTGVAGAA